MQRLSHPIRQSQVAISGSDHSIDYRWGLKHYYYSFIGNQIFSLSIIILPGDFVSNVLKYF